MTTMMMANVRRRVLDGLLASLGVQRVLYSVGSLDEVVDVDAGPLAEHPPDEARSVEEERLDQQHHRHPLVVTDVVLDGARLQPYWRTLRYVVRIRYPAYLHAVQCR